MSDISNSIVDELNKKKRLQQYQNNKYALQNNSNNSQLTQNAMNRSTDELMNKGWTGNKYLTGLFDEGSKAAASSGNMYAAIASAIYEGLEGIYDTVNSQKIGNIKLANQANVQEQNNNMNDLNRKYNSFDNLESESLQRQQMNDKAKLANTLNDKLNARLMPQTDEQFGQDLAQKNEELMNNSQQLANTARENKERTKQAIFEGLTDTANSVASAYGASKGGGKNGMAGKEGSQSANTEVSGQIVGTDGSANQTNNSGQFAENASSFVQPGGEQKPLINTMAGDDAFGNNPTFNTDNNVKINPTYIQDPKNTQYQQPQPEYQAQDYSQTPQNDYEKNIIAKMLERIRGGDYMTGGAAPQQMEQTTDVPVDNSEGQYPLPQTNKLSGLFNRQKQNVYPEGNGNKVLPDYQGNTQSENPIIAYQNSLRDSGKYTDAEIAGVAQGLNSGRPEIQQWLNQFNNGAGKDKPIRIPQTAEEIALAREGKFNEVPQEGNVALNRGGTLKEKLLNGVKDLSAGYKENSTTPFAVENLQGVQGKSKMNKLGEALGTTSRLLANPYMQGLIAGGIYKATGGDLGESINYGVNWAQNKSKSDYYAKKMGQTPGVFTNNFDANDYKVYENELYHQQQLENELAKLNEQERYHNLTFEQKERQMYLNNEIQKSKLRLQVAHENNYQRKIDNEIKNGTKGGKSSKFDWHDYYENEEDYINDVHYVTMDEGDELFDKLVDEEKQILIAQNPSYKKLSDEQLHNKAKSIIKQKQKDYNNGIKYRTGKDITK